MAMKVKKTSRRSKNEPKSSDKGEVFLVSSANWKIKSLYKAVFFIEFMRPALYLRRSLHTIQGTYKLSKSFLNCQLCLPYVHQDTALKHRY